MVRSFASPVQFPFVGYEFHNERSNSHRIDAFEYA